MEHGLSSGGGRGLMVHKPSKASLTSVSSSRKIPDKTVPKIVIERTQLCFRLSDICISLMVIFPLVIGFWRGVWNLSYQYCVKWGMEPWLSIAVGNSIPLVLYLFQEPLRKHVRPRKMNYFVFYLTSRSLLLLHSFGSVNQWRGLWALLDMQFGTGWLSALISLVVGIVCSIGLKTFCNVLAPPLFLAVDDAYAIHDCPLRFQTTIKSKFSYLWDCLLSVFVVASLIISSWRGLWELADLYIYPNDEVKSAATSLMMGYVIALTLFLTQPIIRKTMEKVHGFHRLFIADSITFLGFVGCVFAWRGLWSMYDIYLGTPNYSDWVTLIVGALGSLFLGCISTIITRGVAVDGDVGTDGTSEWPIPYVSLLRDTIHDVPFPEPWLFRYLCTTQNMNIHHLRMKRRKRKEDSFSDYQGNKVNEKVTVIISEDEAMTTMINTTREGVTTASDTLRHIESSDDENEDVAFLSKGGVRPVIVSCGKEIEMSVLKKVQNEEVQIGNQSGVKSGSPPSGGQSHGHSSSGIQQNGPDGT